MKLRSIVLAGLIGTSLLTMSGCNTDDVIDAINEALETSVVHVANGKNVNTSFKLEGEVNNNVQDVNTMSSKMFALIGESSYNVEVLGQETATRRTFSSDSAYLYALCSNGGILTDSATGGARDIEVVNLSDTAIGTDGGGVAVTFYNAAGAPLGNAVINGTVQACQKATLPTVPNLRLADVKFVEVNGARYEVPAYDSDIEAKLDQLNDVDLDLIVFDPDQNNPKGTVVPLATPGEIL